MHHWKIFGILWICNFWAKIECSVTFDSSTFKYPETTSTSHPKTFRRDDESQKEMQDSTVRNFFPVKGKQKWIRRDYPPAEEMLFFNVSVINDNEEVTLAQLHLHRRRLTKIHNPYHKKLLPIPYRVVLYQVQPNYRHKNVADGRTMKLASIPVSHVTKGGWHSLDITAVLRELLINAQGPIELLLGVQFEAPKGIGVPLKHFLKLPANSDSVNSYKTSSYMVVFSEIDPYFDEVDEVSDPVTVNNVIPTQSDLERHSFKERHLKHKIFRDKTNENELPDDSKKKIVTKEENKEKNKLLSKYQRMENEVLSNDYNHRRDDVVRHKNKHRVNDVKRSKADELALQRKNKLKSLPFLHANEVEEIRQTSRRLTRSLPGNLTRPIGEDVGDVPVGRNVTKPKDIRRLLNNLIKEAAKAVGHKNDAGTAESCTPGPIVVDLRNADLGNVKVIAPSKFETFVCDGYCSFPQNHNGLEDKRKYCQTGTKSTLSLLYFDKNGHIVLREFRNFITQDCICR